MNSFCTVITCMDGRIQIPVISYLQNRFQAMYVDTITEAGPVAIVADPSSSDRFPGIASRLDVSIDCHGSCGIALVAHYDCAGNPMDEEKQLQQLTKAVAEIKSIIEERGADLPVIGLWVDSRWDVHEYC